MSFVLKNSQLPQEHHKLRAIAAFRQKNSRLLNSFTINPLLKYFDIADVSDIASVPLFLVVRKGNWSKIYTETSASNTEIISVSGFTRATIPSASYQYVSGSSSITLLMTENSIPITWRSRINSFLQHPQPDRTAVLDRLPTNANPIEAIAGGITFDGSATLAPNKFTITANGEGLIGTSSLSFGTPTYLLIEQSAVAEAQGEFIVFKIQRFSIIYYVEFRGEIYLPVSDWNDPKEYEFYHDTTNDTVIIFTRRNASIGLLYIRDESLAVRVIGVLSYSRPV